MSIANKLVTYAQKYNLKRLNVIEIGSGLGTFASSFLEFVKYQAQPYYHNINYTLLEISDSLIKSSREKLEWEHSDLIKTNCLKFVNKDAFNYNHSSQEPYFLMMFEILDNLPHDLVEFNLRSESTQEAFMENSQMSWRPAQDKLILELFQIWREKYLPNKKLLYEIESEGERLFSVGFLRRMRNFYVQKSTQKIRVHLPTGYLRLLAKFSSQFPHLLMMLSDFSSLPNGNTFQKGLLTLNQPLISKKEKESEAHQDFQSLSDFPKGECDIFFGTDFGFLDKVSQKYLKTDH